MTDGGDQVVFFAMEPGAPLANRLEVGEKFDVIEGAHVGAIVGTAHLGDNLRDFGISAEDGANVVGHFFR